MTAPGDALLLWLARLFALGPLLVLLTLVFVLAVAGRSQAADCGGQDLIDLWRRTAPERLARIEAEAADVPNAQGTFWRVEKPGVAPSYLLGTMHVSDPRVLAMPKGAAEAFTRAGTVIVESDEIADDRKAAASLMSRPDLTMLTDGKTINDYLDEDQREKLKTGLAARGLSLDLVARMRPWMLASFVALPPCELQRKAAGDTFLDKQLADRALKEGKHLKGLETLAEQVEAMNSLPVEFHLSALLETLAMGDQVQDVMRTTTGLYLAGSIGMILPMMEAAGAEGGGEKGVSADFEKRIILDRNRVMATRAAPALDQGGVFMAVGALHLPGEAGVIALLREKGFRISPAN
ncbi:polysaccharide biosynthesis protein GumN [Xaviernesmea oryzae]|uniref:Polysaccharide biosynthesis protein GumN n=1 Tax=Xaviernesmea oryzae TaxID=464029 RepID=A0A1Q9AW19_9HYPH|nr:polysaccharide biosynthesis protein GumN [Xaviernesmea oryzae]